MIGKEEYLESRKEVFNILKKLKANKDFESTLKDNLKRIKNVQAFYKKYKHGSIDIADPDMIDKTIDFERQVDDIHVTNLNTIDKAFINGLISKDEHEIALSVTEIARKVWAIRFKRIRNTIQGINTNKG